MFYRQFICFYYRNDDIYYKYKYIGKKDISNGII